MRDDLARRCEECGTEIPPMADPRRIYCGEPCRTRHLNRLVSEARAEARKGRTCCECGGPIADHKRAHAVYCGRACRLEAQKKRQRRKARET